MQAKLLLFSLQFTIARLTADAVVYKRTDFDRPHGKKFTYASNIYIYHYWMPNPLNPHDFTMNFSMLKSNENAHYYAMTMPLKNP